MGEWFEEEKNKKEYENIKKKIEKSADSLNLFNSGYWIFFDSICFLF